MYVFQSCTSGMRSIRASNSTRAEANGWSSQLLEEGGERFAELRPLPLSSVYFFLSTNNRSVIFTPSELTTTTCRFSCAVHHTILDMPSTWTGRLGIHIYLSGLQNYYILYPETSALQNLYLLGMSGRQVRSLLSSTNLTKG